ncbi:FHA domain-containing protein [candidate division KSB1 bacterium]|nr:FHA domain-containing protein [candidate division KSB1 bacterium]
MPKIVVKKKAEVSNEYPIKAFQTKITIGSEGDNDLIISDNKVSFHHLMIERQGTKFYITDRGSAFGTMLNGVKLEGKKRLSSGDEIKIGEHVLLFENILFEKDVDRPVSPTESIEEEERTGVESTKSANKKYSSKDEPDNSIPKTDATITTYSLLVIYGPYTGKKYRLNQGMTRIGRDSTLNDIVIRKNRKGEVDHSISRRHATIIYEDGDYYIFDKRSKTRTCVNGQLLNEDVVIKLKPMDEIEIISDQENTIFRFLPDRVVDHSAPKYNTDWLVRNSSYLVRSLSFLIIIAALIGSYVLWQDISRMIQKPSPLKFESQLWKSNETVAEPYRQPEEIARYAHMLTPAIGDLNGDKVNDLLFCDKTGYLHSVDGKTKGSIWDQDLSYRIAFPNQLVITDLNGDGAHDVILPSFSSIIYAIDGRTGYEIWNSGLISGEFASSPAIGDLDGNGLKDIVFCTKQGELFVGLSTYKSPGWIRLSLDSETNCLPLIGDIDGDALPEAIIGTDNGIIFIYDGVSNEFKYVINVNEELQKAKGTYFEDHKIRGHLSMGDLNDDGVNDLVVITDKGTILTIAGKTYQRIWYDEIVSSDPFTVNAYMRSAVGDVNGDGKMEVVVITCENSVVAYRGVGQADDKGSVLWKFTPETYDNLLSPPVLADMNKDGSLDVVTVGIFGGIYVLDGTNGESLYNESKSVDIDNASVSIPLIADMNGDRTLDLVVRDVRDQFFLLSSNSIVEKNCLLWPQIHGDANHGAALKLEKANVTWYTLLLLLFAMVIIGLLSLNYYVYQKRKRIFQT